MTKFAAVLFLLFALCPATAMRKKAVAEADEKAESKTVASNQYDITPDLMEPNTWQCQPGTMRIHDVSTCRKAAAALGLVYDGSYDEHSIPSGCHKGLTSGKVYLNTQLTANRWQASKTHALICEACHLFVGTYCRTLHPPRRIGDTDCKQARTITQEGCHGKLHDPLGSADVTMSGNTITDTRGGLTGTMSGGTISMSGGTISWSNEVTYTKVSPWSSACPAGYTPTSGVPNAIIPGPIGYVDRHTAFESCTKSAACCAVSEQDGEVDAVYKNDANSATGTKYRLGDCNTWGENSGWKSCRKPFGLTCPPDRMGATTCGNWAADGKYCSTSTKAFANCATTCHVEVGCQVDENAESKEAMLELKGRDDSATDMIQPYSEAMLEKAHSMVNKHAPQADENAENKEAMLESKGMLEDSAFDMIQPYSEYMLAKAQEEEDGEEDAS